MQVPGRVGRDCFVNFEGCQDAAALVHVGKNVRVRGVPCKVLINADGQVVVEYPHGTKAIPLIDQTWPRASPKRACRRGPHSATERV